MRQTGTGALQPPRSRERTPLQLCLERRCALPQPARWMRYCTTAAR